MQNYAAAYYRVQTLLTVQLMQSINVGLRGAAGLACRTAGGIIGPEYLLEADMLLVAPQFILMAGNSYPIAGLPSCALLLLLPSSP